jgi:hypothetical protein
MLQNEINKTAKLRMGRLTWLERHSAKIILSIGVQQDYLKLDHASI